MPSVPSKKRECPKDSSIMTEIRYETELIDQCTVCGGVWCDGGELEKIIDSREKTFTPEEIESLASYESIGIVSLEVDSNKGIRCLVCNMPMQQKEYMENSGITIDFCTKGHGIWLDAKELERIQLLMERREDKSKANKYAELIKQAVDAKPKIIPSARRRE